MDLNNRRPEFTGTVKLMAALLLALAAASAFGATPTIEDFVRDADVRDMELSPDGTHLAMVLNQDDKRAVIVRNITEPDMPVVGVLVDDVVRPSYTTWGNNNRLLVVVSVPYDVDKVRRDKKNKKDFDINDYFMFSRMFAADRDLTNATVLLEDQSRLRANVSLTWVTNFLHSDENHILMDAYRDDRRTQYRVNLNTGESEQVTRGSSRTFRFINDEDGKPRFRFDYLPRSNAIEIYEYDDDGDWDRVEKIYLNKDDEDSIDSVGLIGLFGDNLVYRKRNEDTGFYELIVVDPESGAKRPLVSLPDQDVRGVIYNPRNDDIIGYSLEQDYVRFVYFDEGQQEEYDAIAAAVGDYNFTVSGLSSSGQKALIASWGSDNPLSYHLWNFETRELTFLAYANKALATGNLSLPAIATYKTRDGTPIRAYILIPNDYEQGLRYPTIMLPHGGPHARSRADYDFFAQFLSTRGYVVIQPNFRGSVGYGREFEEAGYRQWGGVMQDDLADGVAFMVDEGYTDPDKVCIVGGSYGGYAALMGAVKTPSLYRCAISLNGVTHLAEMVEYNMKKTVDKEDWQAILFDRVGNPKDDRAMLDSNSPALLADRISIPVLLIAGTEDGAVPFEQAEMMEKALKKSGADYELIELEWGGHDPFYYRDHREKVLKAVEAFLRENLQ